MIYRGLLVIVFSVFCSLALAADDLPPPKEIAHRLPDLLANLQNPVNNSFMMIRIDVVTLGEANAKLIVEHEPLIRDRILDVLVQQRYIDMRRSESKKALKELLLVAVQKVMKKETEQIVATDIVFHRYVIE